MRVSIKKRFFDQIKSGDKVKEWRGAHLTFVCEETGEVLRKEIKGVELREKKDVDKEYKGTNKFEASLINNNKVIEFDLE